MSQTSNFEIAQKFLNFEIAQEFLKFLNSFVVALKVS